MCIRPLIRLSSLLVAAVLLAACATGPRVSSEADPRADFSHYRSYALYSPLAIESYGYETATSELAKDAVHRHMQALGYVHDPENPDLRVNINAFLERRTDVRSTPYVDHQYYYSYRHRSYFVVPYWSERVSTYRYTEGTMNIDLVDAAQNRLVWEGVAVGRVSKMTPEDREQRINAAVDAIFASYPHRAGVAGTVM